MAHSQDSQKLQRVSIGAVPVIPAPTHGLHEFVKLIEELKSLKNRSQSLDLGKLEDQHTQARDAAIKAVEKKVGRGSSDDIIRLQQEAKKIVEAEHERSKEILISKFQKIDTGLAALSRFLMELGPVKDMESRVHDQEAKLKKMEEELRVQRKVLAHEQEELERDKSLFEAQEGALNTRQKELESKLANLEVVKRAEELNAMQQELEEKFAAYDHEMAQTQHQRDELNRDFDKMGEKRAELDAEGEALATERLTLGRQKAAMADAVAKEMALTFEAFVRDMLRPAAEGAPLQDPHHPAPPPPAAAAPAPKAAPAEAKPAPAKPAADAQKKSDFWQ
jgi:chromosome segregation ATPase